VGESSRHGRVFNLTFTEEEDRTGVKTFVEELRRRSIQVEDLTLDSRSTEFEIASALAKLDEAKYDAVLFSVAVRARSGKGSVALPSAGKRLADELIKRKLPLIVISFGNPYLLAAMPETPSYLMAYSSTPISQRAAAKAILGEIDIAGKLPVTLPRLYPRGHGLVITKRN